ncbi:MAG: hypothetical protein V7K62_22705 [Nostoc sp.]
MRRWLAYGADIKLGKVRRRIRAASLREAACRQTSPQNFTNSKSSSARWMAPSFNCSLRLN